MPAKVQTIPTPAFALGIAGLIPFIVCATLCCIPALGSVFLHSALSASAEGALRNVEVQQKAAGALGAYGAVILSFLGGVRWGNLLSNKTLIRQWIPVSLSVVPSLIAWPALLLPTTWMLSILAAGFVLQYAYDMESVKKKQLPEWFGRLRTLLTTGAVIALLTGLLAVTL